MNRLESLHFEGVEKAEEYALKFLAHGREGWDIPHTKAVVYYAHQIARHENLDRVVFTTTAWLHDIGYFGLFDGNADQHEAVRDKKDLHMKNSAEMAKVFLNEPDVSHLYSQEQKDAITHLVSMHDHVTDLTQLDEIAFMEADTLGQFDINFVKPTFNKANLLKYLPILKEVRLSRFRTETGKRFAAKSLPQYEEYIHQLPE